MDFLNFKTVIFLGVLIDISCTFIIMLLWHYNKKRFAGTTYLVVGWIMQTAALVMIIARGSISDWISIILSNSMVLAGAIIGYIGLERFTVKKSSQVHNFSGLLIFISVEIYFTFFQPNLAVRNMIISAGLLIICFQCMWLVLRRVEPNMRPMARLVGIIFGAYCIINTIRIIEFFINPQLQNDYLESSAFDILLFVAYHILFIFLTFGITLMVNRRLFKDIQTQEEKFSKAFHSSPYAIMLTRLSDGKVFEVNVGFEKITGYPSKEILGKTTFEIRFWVNEDDHSAVVKELLDKGSLQGMELKFRKKSGETMTGLLSADIILINNEKIILSSISDITERKRTEEHIMHLAQHDTLTDLPNRVLFEDRLKQAVALAGRNKEHLALMYLDLDYFKQINDNFGHTVGDSVLMGAARRMLDCVRKSDTVARIGGDEFVILLQDIKEESEALLIADQIRRAVSQPFDLAGHHIRISTSIGIVIFPEYGANEIHLLRNADIAMYHAKESGRDNIKLYKASFKN